MQHAFQANYPLTNDSARTMIIIMKKGLLDDSDNVAFNDLVALCRRYFGEPRIRGSHFIFKTPWQGDPRINIQKDGKMAKPYQVRDVKKAMEKLEAKNEK
jgi:hypothetical protein